MKILALVGSKRKNGNSEILAKEALLCCRENGAEVSLCRLTDLDINECCGCLVCLDPSKSCPQNDDIHFLIDQINESDGLILSIPTFNYNLPGRIKTIQERFLGAAKLIHNNKTGKIKKGFVIISGTQNRLGIAPAMGGMVLMTFLVKVIGTVQFPRCYGPGTSIIKNPDKVIQLKQFAVEIIENTLSNDAQAKQDCPFCTQKVFSLTSDRQVECLFCGRLGRLANQEIIWEDPEVNFTNQDFINFSKQHGPELYQAFRKDRNRLIDILIKYKDSKCDIEWITSKLNKKNESL